MSTIDALPTSPPPRQSRFAGRRGLVASAIVFAVGVSVGIALDGQYSLYRGWSRYLAHAGSPTTMSVRTIEPAATPTPSPDEVRARILTLVNAERSKVGAGPLTANASLERSAEAKLKDMKAKDYWSHYSPDGDSPWDFIDAAGYRYARAGENLARDFATADAVVATWLSSPDHRENMLDPKYTETGIAVSFSGLSGDTGMLVVQHFGQPQQ